MEFLLVNLTPILVETHFITAILFPIDNEIDQRLSQLWSISRGYFITNFSKGLLFEVFPVLHSSCLSIQP